MNKYLVPAFLLLFTFFGHSPVIVLAQNSGPYPVSVGKTTYNSRRLFGYQAANGKMVIDYQYEQAGEFINDRAVVTKGERRGLIDARNNVIVPFQYSEIKPLIEENKWAGTLHDSIFIFNAGGKIILQCPGKLGMHEAAIDRIVINHIGGYKRSSTTLYNGKGKKLAEIQSPRGGTIQLNTIPEDTYPHTYKKNRQATFSHKWLQMTNDAGGYCGAIIDMQGRIVIDTVITRGFVNGIMAVYGPRKAAVVDVNLKEIIPFTAGYLEIFPFKAKAGYYAVKKNGLWGVIDEEMNVVLTPAFKKGIRTHNSELFAIEDNETNEYLYYNYKGEKLAQSINLEQLESRDNPWPFVLNTGKNEYRIWDKQYLGEAYEYISPFSKDGYAYFYHKGKSGILDAKGNIRTTIGHLYVSLSGNGFVVAFDTIKSFETERYACPARDQNDRPVFISKLYFIDLTGQTVFSDSFDALAGFIDGQVSVYKNCEKHIINARGQELPSAGEYVIETGFVNGVRVVADKERKKALMNKQGQISSPWVDSFRTDAGGMGNYLWVYKNNAPASGGYMREMRPTFTNGKIVFQTNGKFGLMDSTGKVVAEPVYSDIKPGASHFIVSMPVNGEVREGILSKKGTVLVNPEYERIEITESPSRFRLIKDHSQPARLYVLPDEDQ